MAAFKSTLWEWGPIEPFDFTAGLSPAWEDVPESTALIQFGELADIVDDPNAALMFSIYMFANAAGSWGRIDGQIVNVDTSAVFTSGGLLSFSAIPYPITYLTLPSSDARWKLQVRAVAALPVPVQMWGFCLEVVT